MPFDNEVFKKLNIATKPHTTLLIPKSSTPNECRNTRDVYNDTNITKIILKDRNMVFFAKVVFLLDDINNLSVQYLSYE